MAARRYNPDYTPPLTLALLGSIVAVTLSDIFTQGYLERLGWARGIDVQYGQYWRLVTAGWIHGDLIHVAFNLYGIYVLGVIFERLHGWKPLLVIYLVSLLGATSLAMAFMDPNIRLVGASGSAYGLFGAVIGYFYAKTGSLRDLWAIPIARTLLIWLGFGVWMSFQPGVSLLGHLGGFVPGVILGVYYEHRYARDLDVYHWISIGVIGLAIVVGSSFACFPVTRASWYGAQALRAYEQMDYDRGDELMQQARSKRQGNQGTSFLLTHLRVWRSYHAAGSPEATVEVLRYPLTHPEMIEIPGHPDAPFHFLKDPADRDAEPLESAADAP